MRTQEAILSPYLAIVRRCASSRCGRRHHSWTWSAPRYILRDRRCVWSGWCASLAQRHTTAVGRWRRRTADNCPVWSLNSRRCRCSCCWLRCLRVFVGRRPLSFICAYIRRLTTSSGRSSRLPRRCRLRRHWHTGYKYNAFAQDLKPAFTKS